MPNNYGSPLSNIRAMPRPPGPQDWLERMKYQLGNSGPYANAVLQQNQALSKQLWNPTQMQPGGLQGTPNYIGQANQNPMLQGLVDQSQGMTPEERNAYFDDLKDQIGERLKRFERRLAGGSALDPAQTARYNNYRQSMNSLSQMANNPLYAQQQMGGTAGGLTPGFMTQSNAAIQQMEQANRPDLAADYADKVRQKIAEEMGIFEKQQSQGLPLNETALARYQQLQNMLAGVQQYIDKMRSGVSLQNVRNVPMSPAGIPGKGQIPQRRGPYSPTPPGTQSF